MADGIELDAGSGGETIATDDVGGIHYQIGKLAFGALDAATLASAGAGNVDGGVQRMTLAADDPAVVDLAAIEVLLGTIAGDTTAIEAAVEGTLTVAGTVDLGAVDNAVLDAIAASLAALDNSVGGNELQVDVVAALPAGDNNIGNVDIVSGVITTVSTVTTVSAVTAITNALPAGTNAIGKLAANSGVDIGDVDVTSISAGTNLIADVGIQPRTTLGFDTFMASGSDGSSILVATAQVIKASAGKLYGYYAYNPEAAATFVHFYNTAAASVTVGTTNPLFTLAIPAGSAANLMSEIGITFSNAGWSTAATTTAAGNGAPATGVSLVAWYK